MEVGCTHWHVLTEEVGFSAAADSTFEADAAELALAGTADEADGEAASVGLTPASALEAELAAALEAELEANGSSPSMPRLTLVPGRAAVADAAAEEATEDGTTDAWADLVDDLASSLT